MINRIIAWFLLGFIALSSIVMFVIALFIWAVTILFDRRLVILHQFSCFWASLYLWVMPAWKVVVEGRKKIRRGITYVVISNHQSLLDILVAFRLFFPFKWVSKAEIFRIPLIGWNMVLNRYIKLVRGDKQSIRKMMGDAEKALRQGSSVFFFPEGTRSANGVLKPFKPGAFILAQKLKLPILPVVINGTRNALPKYSLNFHGKKDILVKVLDEIPYSRFADMAVEELAEMARGIIGEQVDEHKKTAAV